MKRKQKISKKLKKELTIEIKSWKDLRKLYYGEYKKHPLPLPNFSLTAKDNNLWIFRGENIKTDLQTHLEKVFDSYGISSDDKSEREIEFLRKFQREAAHYVEHEPHKNNILEWLALMRHYGAPTRLMDWTYSFFVAVYFALAENSEGVVWALNAGKLKLNKAKVVIEQIKDIDENKYKKYLDKKKKILSEMDDVLNLRSIGCKLDDEAIICCFLKYNPVSTVYFVNPFKLNPRLTIQQGLFLAPGNIRETFWYNLTEGTGGENKLKKCLHRIEINVSKNKDERNAIIRWLCGMNISNAVLFPDLGGFAKSLGESLARPLIIDKSNNIETV